jgi:type II secretory pathway pseudopilin PulG
MKLLPAPATQRTAAFTMVEIALCLAIIGFALAALIGIMPAALNVQKENRQETVINNDASIWLDAMRSGATSFPAPGFERNVITFTNWTTEYDPATLSVTRPTYPRGLDAASMDPAVILGLLCTPRTYLKGNTLYSNYVVATVRAFTAPAVFLPPQDGSNTLDNAFTYRLSVDITAHRSPPELVNTNFVGNLAKNLHDVQLLLEYPLLPGGKAKWGLVYRASIGGELLRYREDWPAPAAAGGWTADLFAFRPNTYVRPQP